MTSAKMPPAKITPERWLRIENLFHSVLERETGERAAFLAQACDGDAELRAQVEALLASLDEAGDFIEQSPVAQAVSAEQIELAAGAGSADALIGCQIGAYEILSLLGAGGMGEVYLARDGRLDRQIALKLLPVQVTEDAAQVRRFEREARAASALNHPNIITIYEVGQDSGVHFIATEFIAGTTLREKMNAADIALGEALSIAAQIANALGAAHAAGIVHRDIKPENVMVRPDGLVKVLDFGLAKPLAAEAVSGKLREPEAVSLQTDPRMLMGTLAYLSPEQARGERVDGRTDLFSLGAVVYEMSAGKRPFTGGTSAEILDAILNRQPDFPIHQAGTLSGKLSAALRRALEKDRHARYQTADEFSADLQRIARELDSPAALPASGPERFTKNGWPVKTALAFALLIAAGVTWWRFGWASKAAVSPWLRATSAKLTAYPGEEFTPSLSPDGKSLIFVHQIDGDYDICWKRLEETGFKNLTPDCAADDLQPAFSPDGMQIAFQSDCGGGIFLMGVNGEGRRRLSDAGYNPVWSPDGKEVLYSTGNALSPFIRRTAGGQLWAVNAATGEKRRLATPDAMQPVYSPRGLRVAYWGVNPAHPQQRDIWTIPAQGGAPVAVTSDAALDWNPVWAPDGQYLYFVSNRSGEMSLWRVPIEEATGKVQGALETVTGPSGETWQPSFSRDGRHLLYVQRNVRGGIESTGFDPVKGIAVGKSEVITQGTQRPGFPDLSPDGEWLAYYNFGAAQEDIFLVRQDGSETRQLTHDACKDRMPRWSPDGRQIAFYSDCGGTDQIWTVNLATRERRQITYQQGGAQYPVWSPDGARLVYHSRGAGAFILDTGKSWQEQTPVTLAPMPAALPATGRWFVPWSWSPDGRWLAGVIGSTDEDFPGIWVYQLGSGQYQSLSKTGEFPIWLNDSRRLFFPDRRRLHLADIRTGNAREILSIEPLLINYGLPSRDGRRIYYTVRAAESDIQELSLN